MIFYVHKQEQEREREREIERQRQREKRERVAYLKAVQNGKVELDHGLVLPELHVGVGVETHLCCNRLIDRER